jgi:hypothetical protein
MYYPAKIWKKSTKCFEKMYRVGVSTKHTPIMGACGAINSKHCLNFAKRM